MFRQALYRLPASASRQFSSTIASRSVVGKTKQILNDANQKVGKVLADSMDTVEKAAENAPTPKEALDATNKKVGKVLADGLETAEETVASGKETAEKVANKAGDKAEDTIASGKETAQKVANKAGEKAEDIANTALAVEQRARVKENHQGYSSLQDKGSKVETEQQRPDDAVGR